MSQLLENFRSNQVQNTARDFYNSDPEYIDTSE